jgi:hypothetical protein
MVIFMVSPPQRSNVRDVSLAIQLTGSFSGEHCRSGRRSLRGPSERGRSAESVHGFADVVVHSLDVERVVLIAALKPGAREQALDLLQRPADASEQERVTQRQGIFLSDREAVFFFEGRSAGALVRELVNDPVRSTMLSPWLPLFEGPLHLAREAYFLDHGGDE